MSHPDFTTTRPLKIGSRLHLLNSRASSMPSGARRANHAQADMVIKDSKGKLWQARCIQWAYKCLYEIKSEL